MGAEDNVESVHDRESRLLHNPIVNAGELVDLYDERLSSLFKVYDLTGDFDVEPFFDLCNRLKVVSSLLPDSDPRKYGGKRAVFSSTGQQRPDVVE